MKLAPSVLAADFVRLGEQVAEVARAGADRLHVDVMDGVFVPNISMGPLVVEALKRASDLPLEVHLMIVEPDRHLEAFAEAGAHSLIVHQETCPHLHRSVQRVKALGLKAGVAINPATPVPLLDEILPELDLALVMTVNPGFGGQAFIARTLDKVRMLAARIQDWSLACELEVDGGIDAQTAPRVRRAGATVAVAGTAVFAHPDGIAAGAKALLEAPDA